MTNLYARVLVRLIFGFVGICILCAGCSVRRVTYNEAISTDKIQFIQTGHTTMLDIVAKLGAPDEITESETGVVALYNWSDAKSASIDFGALAGRFLPISPPLTLGRTGIAPEQFLVVFDDKWAVRAYGFSRWPKEDNIVWFWPF